MSKKAKKSRAGKDQLKYEILGVLFFAAAIFITVSLFVPTGIIGDFLIRLLTIFTGKIGCLLVAGLLVYFTCSSCWFRQPFTENPRNRGVILLFLVVLVVLHLIFLPGGISRSKAMALLWENGLQGEGGGVLGAVFSIALLYLLGRTGTFILTAALSVISLTLLTGIPFSQLMKSIGDLFAKAGRAIKAGIERFIFIEEETFAETVQERPKREEKKQDTPVIIDYNAHSSASEEIVEGDNLDNLEEEKAITTLQVKEEQPEISQDNYNLPPLELLRKPLKVKSNRLNKELIENVRILEETLGNFGIKVCVSEVHKGPAITRYEIQPAPGVKVSRIMRLADDIALSLAAAAVRIEAPIPGKAAMGIEVPNKEISIVCLREILETSEFRDAASKLTIALGKDIAGNPIITDLAKMPHLLIAGATGSGKSVCLNTIICSILYKAFPSEVKLLMIDPKMVELITYNGIPHLVAPVVTEPKKAAAALRWAVKEMENRYELFASQGVKDIARYNKQIITQKQEQQRPLPYIVIVIDELSDLMVISPVDVEDAICRLAQMARAAGIHLVIATQRPSVDVITGVIKANIPSRIAFAVSSQTDSRTILDLSGAEKLLGRGDMLFIPVGALKPLRIQGALVTESEVEEIVNYLIKQGDPAYLTEFPVQQEEGSEDMDYGDELFYDAAKLVIEMGHASASLLQRRLRVGYTRAARLIDILEAKGIVGPFEGSKPRDVLMTSEQFHRYFGR
ncbi:MAG: DNA translocase FtsK 4TM domain-containing protein [Syntrophaceticus sp.]